MRLSFTSGLPVNPNVQRHVQERSRLPLLVLLATLFIKKSKSQTTPADKAISEKEAMQALNECNRINPSYEPTFAVKGLLHIRRRELDQAKKNFIMAIDRKP